MTGIRSALLAVAGVSDATVEMADEELVGVRVVLEEGADERLVATSVQEVLGAQGLRARLAPPRRKLEPVAPPPPPTLLEARSTVAGVEAAASEIPTGTDKTEGEASEIAELGAELVEVAISERRGAAQVRVTSSAAAVDRPARASPEGVREAIISAVAALLSYDPPPMAVLTEFRETATAEVVTVVLDVGEGELRAGASLVSTSREVAVARAAWRALSA